MDSARRLGYRLNDRQEIELWLWPGLDIAPGALPRATRAGGCNGIRAAVPQCQSRLDGWMARFGRRCADSQAVRLRIVLASGEEIVRVFGLRS